MSVPLRELLEDVLDGEPPLGNEVDAVFQQAAALARRRIRVILASGTTAAVVLAVGGYLMAGSLAPNTDAALPPPPPTLAAIPDRSARLTSTSGVTASTTGTASATGGSNAAADSVDPSSSASNTPGAGGDPVLAVIAPLLDDTGMRIVPRPPERGAGWRQYSVFDADGEPRGTVVTAVYSIPDSLCFPPPDEQSTPPDEQSTPPDEQSTPPDEHEQSTPPDEQHRCASADRTGDGMEYLRYDDLRDEWQTHETIARRRSDGRTVVVMATGPRDKKQTLAGRPPLTGVQTRQIATDQHLADAFGPNEQCDGPAASACPVFRVMVPSKDSDQQPTPTRH